MSKKMNCIFTLLAVGAMLTACSQTGSEPSESTRTISGTSQKGPFIEGTEVTLYGMDEKLRQTGSHFSTTIDNNQGKYTLKNIPLDERYAWLNANGYYIDEIYGRTSVWKLSLNSLVDLQKTDQVNINVLTHLSFDRIRYLVKEGKSVDEAKRQAEKEVMDAFGFSGEGDSFEHLDILNGGEDDAKLLAISLLMLTSAADIGDVTDRLASIAMDLETDGVWNDSTMVDQMRRFAAMHKENGLYERIRQNLVSMGAAQIPDFQKYLEQFAVSWESTWGNCDAQTQDVVRRPTPLNSTRVICRDGVWKYYSGQRDEGEAPIDTAGKYGTLIDGRDGHVYKTLDVGLNDGTTATWMVNLLEYEIQGDSGDVYHIPGVGRSYTFCQIIKLPEGCLASEDSVINERLLDYNDHILYRRNFQGICPDGWHIPQSYEWEKLVESIKDDYQARELLVYPQYRETDADSSFAGSYFIDIEYSYGLDEYNVWNVNGGNYSYDYLPTAYLGLRCVKD